MAINVQRMYGPDTFCKVRTRLRCVDLSQEFLTCGEEHRFPIHDVAFQKTRSFLVFSVGEQFNKFEVFAHGIDLMLSPRRRLDTAYPCICLARGAWFP